MGSLLENGSLLIGMAECNLCVNIYKNYTKMVRFYLCNNEVWNSFLNFRQI